MPNTQAASDPKPETCNNTDASTLLKKYRSERAKRIREDGEGQYRTIDESSLNHFVDDPWLNRKFTREPTTKEVDVLIIGGGFGGQLVAVRLLQAGIKNIMIIERAADFGGTWYWNRYPGLSCDIESYIYLPLLEEMDYIPTEKYAKGDEILEYARKIGERFDLYSRSLFQTEVNALEWNDAEARWIVTTNREDQIRARFFAAAGGPMQRLKFPGIPGIETFGGRSFHTSRWNYEYTGGNQQGDLHKLGDKRVGIIGTGSSAVQVVPHLAMSAKQLYVFQRTPSSVDVRLDRWTDPKWAEKMRSTRGWQRQRMENFNIIATGGSQEEDLVGDGWTDICHNLSIYGGREKPTTLKEMTVTRQMADLKKMSQIRDRVDKMVKEPETARKLKPWYNQFCKRPCFNNEYLASFNRRNVTLIDTTEGSGLESIDKTGIRVNGQHIDLDCIIYATGFESNYDYSQGMGIVVRGRKGLRLGEKWKDGPLTLHGIHTRGFPNSFTISSNQSGFTPNFMHALDEQSRHVAYIVSEALQRKSFRSIEASQDAEDSWVATIVDLARLQLDFVMGCTPGYYNMEGVVGDKWLRSAPYGLGSPTFFRLMHSWRKEGKFQGLEVMYEDRDGSSATNMEE